MPGHAAAAAAMGLWIVALAWMRTIPAVAGEPEVGKNCPKECPPTAFLSRPILLNLLQSYENITCRGKTSVILTTKKNRAFCARPEHRWVQTVMRQLDAKNSPPPSESSTPVQGKPGVFDKLSRDAVPTSAVTVGHARPTGTVTYSKSTEFPGRRTRAPEGSTVNATSVGAETTSASRESTAKTEEAGFGTSFEPQSVANGNTVSPTTERPKRFGEDLTPGGEGQTPDSRTAHDLVTAPTVIGTQSTTHRRFDPQNPRSSSEQSTSHLPSSPLSGLSTDSVEKVMVSSTTSTMFLTSPSVPASVLSTGSRLQTTVGPPNLDVTDLSSTHSSIDRNNNRSISIQDRSDAMITVAFGGTLGTPVSAEGRRDAFSSPPVSQPTSGFPKEHVTEKSRAQATTYAPEVTSTLLPGDPTAYRTHIISLLCAGVLVAFAVVGWLWLKSNIPVTTSPKEMVQGLLYNSGDSQANEYAMQLL